MKLHVSFAVPPGTPAAWVASLLSGIDLEADAYHIDRLGTLHIFAKNAAGAPETVVVYAPGAWRSVADVGAMAAAVPKEAPGENSRRR